MPDNDDKMDDDFEDEDISLDLGKIKNIFKGKKDKKPESHKTHSPNVTLLEPKKEHKKENIFEDPEDEPDDISFDFKKVKSWFKPKKEEADEEDINIDWKAAKGFLTRYGILLLLLIPVFLSISIRSENADIPATDQWARSSVDNYLMGQVRAQIDSQYPNMAPANKNALISAEFQRMKERETTQYDAQVEQTSAFFKEGYKDPEGKFYVPDIDPYFWYRHAKNIVENGHPGDEIRDGKPWDNHMMAPIGREVPPDMFHAYFLAGFYKFQTIFNKDIDILHSIIYYPVFISALSVIFIFFIGRKLAGNVGGLFAATFAAITTPFVSRTLLGHADSDAWVVFFSVAVTWFYLAAIDSKVLWKRLSLAVIAGGMIGLYAWAWGGWWNIFGFLTGSTVIYLGFYTLLHRRELKKGIKFFRTPAIWNSIIVLAIFIIASGIGVSLASSPQTFLKFPGNVLRITAFKAPVKAGSLWPNVLTTVAELNPGSVGTVVSQFGGKLIYFMALLGVVLSISPGIRRRNVKWLFIAFSALWFLFMASDSIQRIQPVTYLIMLSLPMIIGLYLMLRFEETTTDPKYIILLTIWFVATIYATIKGVRFTLLLAPAFSIAFGTCIGILTNETSKFLSRELKVKRLFVVPVLVALFGVLLIGPAKAGYAMAGQDIPIVNDAWYDSLTAIKEDSDPDNTVINSWWDFGHHFKAIADRPVTFDGTTQGMPQAHWIGKVLLTDNEEQAMGILRMLDCGANTAFDVLFEITGDHHESVQTLYDIFEKDRDTALLYLTEKYGELNAIKIIQLTHCDPPVNYFIASDDMIGKSGVWSHFGSWNFSRADIYKNTRYMDMDEAVSYMQKFGFETDYAEQLYYEVQSLTTDKEGNDWIAPWPSYASELNGCNVVGDLADCGNGLTVNLTTMEPSILSPQGPAKPKAFAYADKEGVHKKTYESDFPFGVAFIPQGDNYAALYMVPELTASMYTVMYFYRGHGLLYFDFFDYRQGFTGTRVFVYKVDWEGKGINVIDEFIEKFEVSSGDRVTMQYVGYFENGTVFDSSILNETHPPSDADFDDYEHRESIFTAGQGEVIKGFDEGIIGMVPGEEKALIIPPEDGYGSVEGHPLQNETLHFRIKVIRIK
ncbi:MAG: FKBP-type peptidyl-prolyl cis-trans isomerase [Nanoarchaeota archaeon]|nr:FKBP-type peptidyl-prolyl cis-trans isomerase [Nanoarchaeota archaeon]